MGTNPVDPMHDGAAQRYAQMAAAALAQSLNISPNEIRIGPITKEQIPAPPNSPGTMHIDPVYYRYIIYLELGAVPNVYRYRGEGGKVFFEAQA